MDSKKIYEQLKELWDEFEDTTINLLIRHKAAVRAENQLVKLKNS